VLDKNPITDLVSPDNFNQLIQNRSYLIDESGSKSYPLIKGRIPVLTTNPILYLANEYLMLARHLETRKHQYNLITQEVNLLAMEPGIYSETIIRMKENDLIFEELLSEIKAFIEIDDIVFLPASHLNQPTDYNLKFSYLVRDWVFSKEGENEISLIKTKIIPFLNNRMKHHVLLGSGTGRIAYEFSENAECTTALDNSSTMAFLHDKVQEGDFSFYEENFQNINDRSDICKKRTATSKKINLQTKNQVQNIIGDANNLPFQRNSIEAISSIFFTDVIPFSNLLKEVKRVLKEGGLFIHYGPLNYHFRDLRNILSFQEIVNTLVKNGFTISHKESFRSPHCEAGLSTKLLKSYTIWLLVATKNHGIKIKEESILSIVKPLKFRREGTIDNSTYAFDSVILLENNSEFQGADSVLEILNQIDGETNFANIIKNLEEIFGAINTEQKDSIKSILEDLINKGALRIVSP